MPVKITHVKKGCTVHEILWLIQTLPIFLGENFQEAKEIARQINNFDKNTQYYVLIYRFDPAEVDLSQVICLTHKSDVS